MTDADFGTPESPLLTNARRALDVARLIHSRGLTSFYNLAVTGHEVSAQTDNDNHARTLAWSLCKTGQEPAEDDWRDSRGDRHLWLTVGGVRVICHQPAKEAVA